MEEPTEHTADLAFSIFDRYGRLRKEFKDHPIKRGSGIWQDELDNGDLLLFEVVSVQKPFRRRGLGRKLVAAMLEKSRQKSRHFFAVVSPGYLTDEVDKETRNLSDAERESYAEREVTAATAFWRSLGFRRIGSSRWFAMSIHESHPCYNLSLNDDYDPAKPPQRVPYADVEPLFQDLFFVKAGNWHEKFMEVFQHLSIDDPRWQATDNQGNTVLHAAAVNEQPQSIERILSQNPELLNRRNDAGETPLEALEFHLETRRTRQGTNILGKPWHISDKFEGFSEDSVMCLIKLKCLVNTTQLGRLRLTYGCTCGECSAGFLSPRMRHALLCQAEVQHDLANSEIDTMSGDEFVMMNDYLFKYLEPSVRGNLKTNKSMRQGFCNLCGHFARCTEKDSDLLPTQSTVLSLLQGASEWPPHSRNFLQRGGTIYSVGSMLFELARIQDRYAGDGDHYNVFKDDIIKLPECRNDHEFGFASGMCGYKRVRAVIHISASTGEEIE